MSTLNKSGIGTPNAEDKNTVECKLPILGAQNALDFGAIQDNKPDAVFKFVEQLQSLWSGYGAINRIRHVESNQTYIVKLIKAPETVSHPRGWNTTTSHDRKMKSYQIEMNFYQDVAPVYLALQYAQTQRFKHLLCKIAQPYHIRALEDEHLIVMEDLDASGFNLRNTEPYNTTDVELVACIKWLANFHAIGLYQAEQNSDFAVTLWPIGSYWHLATRQDEFAAMAESSLKWYATDIDQQLNHATFKTVIHGDAKVANFCFDQRKESVSAVDFQYVGKGVGVKDLAYLLGSCLTNKQLLEQASRHIDEYFYYLKQAWLSLTHTDERFCMAAHADGQNSRYIEGRQHISAAEYISLVEVEWRTLYSYAWADFHRFLAGWSPEHSKINAYMQQQTDTVIKSLDSVARRP